MTGNWSELAAEFASKAWDGSSILPLSREFALNHLPHLQKRECIEFIAANLIRFDKHYNKALLLCCPELWTDWTIEDWLTLAQRLSPRPSRKEFYDTGAYMDFVFLTRWIKIDALEMLRQADCISESDKLSILTYCWVWTPLFMDSGGDFPIGWSSDEECLALLHEAQQKLLKSSTCIKPAHQNTNEFLAKVKSLLLHFGGDPSVVNFERH